MKGTVMTNTNLGEAFPRRSLCETVLRALVLGGCAAVLFGCGSPSTLMTVDASRESTPYDGSWGGSGQASTPDDGAGQAVSQLPDADRDGIADELEAMLGTNPDHYDSDFDGLTDHYELWGIDGIPLGSTGSLSELNDPNGNGIIAPLDAADLGAYAVKDPSVLAYRERVPVTLPEEGSFSPHDVDGDGIPNDFELYGFYFEVDENNMPWFVRWPWWSDLWDLRIPYFKTDPTKWSTDGDPFSDWEEATKINLDQRLKSPGDHPCIPAYPQLEAFLTSYSIELMQDVEVRSATGGKTESSWTEVAVSIDEMKTSYFSSGVETDTQLTAMLGMKIGEEYTAWAGGPAGGKIIKGPSVDFTAAVHVQSETMYIGAASTANVSGNLPGGAASMADSKSGLTAEEWATATTTAFNTAEVARLILNLKIINTGTLPATNSRILFNLYLGDVAINSFVVPMEEFGELLPMAENPVDVVVTHDGRSAPQKPMGDPMVLSMDQLRSIESGVPLKIESTGFVADTLVWDIDPDTGRRTYLTMGPWAPYESAIQNSSARIILDFSNDPTYTPASINGLPPRGVSEFRVFCHNPNSGYIGSAPPITLTDAFVWAFEAKNSSIGPIVTIRDPISRATHTSPIAGWEFAFDKLTIEKIIADPTYADNVFFLPLEPSNPGERIYTCKAPPQGERAKPRIYWATCDPLTRKVRAFSYDVRGVSEMRFKPDPAADYDGELMRVGFDPEDPGQAFAYTYELPAQYKWTGFEQVVAINRAEKRTEMTIQILGAELGHLIESGSYGIVWSDQANPYIQGFNFSGGTITNPLFDLTFQQAYDGNNLQLTLTPRNGGGLHDALYVIDPDPYGDPPEYLLDYNYLRKQNYDPVQALGETIDGDGSSEPPLCKTFAVKSQTGVLAVFKPELTSMDIGGGQYRYFVSSIIWRTYEGI